MLDPCPPPEETGSGLKTYWLATTEMAPFSGGIGVYAHQTAAMLAAHGVATTVFHHDAEVGDPQVGFRGGYRLIRFASRTLDRRPIEVPNLHGFLRAAFETDAVLADLLAQEAPPDVVEFQDYGALAYFFLRRRLFGFDRPWPKTVLTAHRPLIHCAWTDGDSVYEHRTAFLGDAERWCYAAADAVLAPARFIVDALAAPDMHFDLSRATVVRNPMDLGALRTTATDPDLEPERIALAQALHTPDEPVLYLGKLQAQKGGWDLLASLSALATEGRAPPLWMLGRDAFLSGTATTAYDFLETRYAPLFRSGAARYLGGYDLADLRTLCAGHPIAVLPYREDCLPYAFVEAALCGALPLTSAAGGQAELIPPDLRHRLTADFTRPDALGAALEGLLALDPGRRRAMSQALAAEVARQTDPATVFARKSAALDRVATRGAEPDYPFAYGPALAIAQASPTERARLAASVPQLGATLSLRRAGADRPPTDDLASVVVPFYEMQAHVEETLASVEAQGHAAIEVILVDDGSPSPEARAKLDALLDSPRRFPTTLLRKYNGGLADARNAGAKIARGDYLYFLDPDDTIHPTTLERSLAVLKRYANVGYVGASLKEFGDSDGDWTVFDIDGPYLGFHNLQICAFLARAGAWLAHGVNDPRMSLGMEDYESHVRMAAAGVRGVALPGRHFNYRMRAGSMSKRFDGHGKAHLYRRILQANPEFFRRHGPQLVGMAAENGHGALAPSVTVRAEGAASLFRRDIPAPEEIAEDLERTASREGLGRALRARCEAGGAEWDYLTGRLLLALDHAPAFARDLLGAAAAHAPANGWFRLYAMIARLRAGRWTAAARLRGPAFDAFCAEDGGAVAWIAGLEAVRGFPHVARTLDAWRGADATLRYPEGYGFGEPATEGVDPRFTALGEALARLLYAAETGPPRRWRPAVEDAVAVAAGLASPEAARALLNRWIDAWREAGRIGAPRAHALAAALGASPQPRDTATALWGRSAAAYRRKDLAALLKREPMAPAEAEDARGWLGLPAAPGAAGAAVQALPTTLRRLWIT